MYFERLSRRLGADFHHYFQISIKYRYVYVSTPKVACTSLKSSLMRLELAGYGLPHQVETAYARPHRGYLDSGFVKPFQMGAHAFDEFVSRPDVIVFAVLRDPLSRALAGYLDKVLKGTPIFETIRDEIATLRGVDAVSIDPASTTFNEFLAALEMKSDPRAIDGHFRPQATHLGFGTTPFTHLFRIEEFPALECGLRDHIGIKDFSIGRVGAHATNSTQKLHEYYDGRALENVQRIFAEDFDAFDYACNLPDLGTRERER